MTDISSVKAHADSQPTHVALYGAPPPFLDRSPALDGTIGEEESSTIKCICGFPEDDGNTVLCEKCDTWQHIVCYYESPQHVPDIHECTDCLPRPVDARGAAEKQRQRRELQNLGERKGKPKTSTKSGKKRVKEPLGQVQLNGWAVHANGDLHYSTERKSGSPRDQPPPNKRPKTTHRSTNSVSLPNHTPNLAGARKRAASTLHNGHQSPTKSPVHVGPNGSAIEDFSPEFMQLYRQPDPPSIDSNSFTDIRVANDISLWLNDREALAEATDGMEPSQIFERVEQTMDELESMAPVIVKQCEQGSEVTANGLHPLWQYLTVEGFVPTNGYIGELKGQIGRRLDYFSNPSNRWDFLQHPEPFVFFPPHLPIYIDTRREGTKLRYARRSCRPNMKMKILTQSNEGGYHFCFIANEDIHPDDELTVGWEITPDMHRLLHNAVTNGDIRKEGFKKLEHLMQWISRVLSNFGGCACQRSKDNPCFLDLARRTGPATHPGEPGPPPKTSKSKKTRISQVSPLSTGRATNSRAGSEVFTKEGHEDDMESRSTTGSHSKPGSRDITPMTHFSVEGDMRLSDRERRKIQQQERLFEQLEYDEQHGSKRRKRHSGSALNTPGLSSSKQLGHSELSPSTLKSREHSNGGSRKLSSSRSKANGCPPPPKPRPVYVDSSTQTDDSMLKNAPTTPLLKRREMKPLLSFKRRLLKGVVADRLQRERVRSVKLEVSSPVLEDVASAKMSPVSPRSRGDGSPVVDAAGGPSTMVDASTGPSAMVDAAASPGAQAAAPSPKPAPLVPNEDVEMQDIDDAPAAGPKATSPKVEEMPDAPSPALSSATSHPPIQPDPPPWPAAPPTQSPPPSISLPPKPSHLQIPPHPTVEPASQPGSAIGSAVTPGSNSGMLQGTIAQSPLSAGPISSPFSPSVASAINSAPPRKKLSLSDYTSRKAKLAQSQSSTVGASQSSGHLHSLSPLSSNPPQASPTKSPEITMTTIVPPVSHDEIRPAVPATTSASLLPPPPT